jgi:hypothetical protein
MTKEKQENILCKHRMSILSKFSKLTNTLKTIMNQEEMKILNGPAAMKGLTQWLSIPSMTHPASVAPPPTLTHSTAQTRALPQPWIRTTVLSSTTPGPW